MTNGKTLPAIPASDEKSLSANYYNAFYKQRTRDFWGDNEIIRERPSPFKKCNHFFVSKAGGAECKKCHFGLVGTIKITNGKITNNFKKNK